ncbi:AraC-like DNA-binding protein [Caulobacter ginsengisoli]|uniref:AraC-like DNA-binding protein n=1 Tax=Caulobacter ginsengisoli TaxID=400775 RepID=A0ABU0IMX4_9CAUL|nr:helix-turn-helix domain-containing protein [Caulobacter ginsengisoli]MDQ0462765.1 AraC-like DNA-binding protein [Caulobacter ginsengisoli]
MTPAFIGYGFANPTLAKLAASAWGQSYVGSTGMLPGLIAPDAHVEVILQLGAPCSVVSGERVIAPPRAMVYALRHGAVRLKPTGDNTMVAFRLAPVVASAVLRANLADCWDRPVALADLIGPEADRLMDRIADAPLEWAGEVLEAWLLARLADWSSDDERQADLQQVLLWDVADQPVAVLADQLGFTARTLRRHCQAYAGLSPKQLTMSGRMLRACDLLLGSPGLPLAEAALRLGFNDQSAFANAFRHYLGLTPTQLRAQPLVFYERRR